MVYRVLGDVFHITGLKQATLVTTASYIWTQNHSLAAMEFNELVIDSKYIIITFMESAMLLCINAFILEKKHGFSAQHYTWSDNCSFKLQAGKI